jgi:hypothetical protein
MKVPFGTGGVDLASDTEGSDPDSFVKDRSPERISKNAPVHKRGEVINDASTSN